MKRANTWADDMHKASLLDDAVDSYRYYADDPDFNLAGKYRDKVDNSLLGSGDELFDLLILAGAAGTIGGGGILGWNALNPNTGDKKRDEELRQMKLNQLNPIGGLPNNQESNARLQAYASSLTGQPIY